MITEIKNIWCISITILNNENKKVWIWETQITESDEQKEK